MKNKPKILVFIDWFWPGYLAGGPVQSLVSLVSYLGSDIDFKIITTNRDLNGTTAYPDIKPGTWLASPLGCEVFYAEPVKLNKAYLKQVMDQTAFDAVYINSFFSKYFSVIPLHLSRTYYKNKPVILAPRGMLGEGALAIKNFKKRAFILYSKMTGFHSSVIWQATSRQEEQEISKLFHPGKEKIIVISNLPKKLDATAGKTKQQGALNLFFLSRISEKKNLVYALETLAKIKDVKINYNIYGPLEDDAYWAGCQEIISRLPVNISVAYRGSLAPEDIGAALAGEHVLFLPTLNENFGHAIVESLFCGCPAVISDQTPWNDLEQHDAGYAIALNERQEFITALLTFAGLSQTEFLTKSQAAAAYIHGKLDLAAIKTQYKNLFYDCIKNGPVNL